VATPPPPLGLSVFADSSFQTSLLIVRATRSALPYSREHKPIAVDALSEQPPVPRAVIELVNARLAQRYLGPRERVPSTPSPPRQLSLVRRSLSRLTGLSFLLLSLIRIHSLTERVAAHVISKAIVIGPETLPH